MSGNKYFGATLVATTDRGKHRRAAALQYAFILWLSMTVSCGGVSFSPSVTPNASSSVPSYYGSGIQFDSLSNAQVAALDIDYRFRASTTAALSSFLWYSTSGPNSGCNGYGCGTGGSLQVCLYSDDGSDSHLWNAAQPIACLQEPNLRGKGGLRSDAFSTAPQLQAGTLYHLHWHNSDPNHAQNYTSVNNLFVWHATTPRQPTVSDTDLAVLEGTQVLTQFSPIFQLNYDNGSVQGQGYMECWIQAPADISDKAMVRENFTVTDSNRLVSAVSVRVNRASGNSPLILTLATLSGTVLAQGSVAASNFPQQALSGDSSANQPVWGRYQFPAPLTLVVGQSYQLQLSATADTRYQAYGIHKGTIYNFHPPSFFRDGYSQFSIDNGNSWTGFNQPNGPPNNLDADIQFFFERTKP